MAILALAVVSAVALSRAGAVAITSGRAQAVADVAALGAVVHGESAAAQIAAANGATVRSLDTGPEGVLRVEVELRGSRASAAASTRPR